MQTLVGYGAIQVAPEELRRIRVCFRSMPAISAFHAVVSRGPKGERRYVQAQVPGMWMKKTPKVWHRIDRQREPSDEVAAIWEATIRRAS